MSTGDTVSVTVKMPLEMREALDDAMVEEGYASRSDAARAKIEQGLNGKPGKPKRAAAKAGGCAHPPGRRIGDGCAECGDPDAHR